MKYIFVAHFACKSLLSLKIAVGSCQELLPVVVVLKLLVKFISVFASFFRLLITFYWRINFFVATTADFTYLANLQAHQKISNLTNILFVRKTTCGFVLFLFVQISIAFYIRSVPVAANRFFIANYTRM